MTNDFRDQPPVRPAPGTDTGRTHPRPHVPAAFALAVLAILAIAVVATFSSFEAEEQFERSEAPKQAVIP